MNPTRKKTGTFCFLVHQEIPVSKLMKKAECPRFVSYLDAG
jgi:hypothetical protein